MDFLIDCPPPRAIASSRAHFCRPSALGLGPTLNSEVLALMGVAFGLDGRGGAVRHMELRRHRQGGCQGGQGVELGGGHNGQGQLWVAIHLTVHTDGSAPGPGSANLSLVLAQFGPLRA